MLLGGERQTDRELAEKTLTLKDSSVRSNLTLSDSQWREKETDRQRETERDRDRQTARDRDRERHTQRHTETETENSPLILRDSSVRSIWTCLAATREGQTMEETLASHTERETERERDSLIHWCFICHYKGERQTDRQTDTQRTGKKEHTSPLTKEDRSAS